MSHRILLSASPSRPIVEFLSEVSACLLDAFGCDIIEIWLRERSACSCWLATREPRRISRLGDAPREVLDSLVHQGVIRDKGESVDGAESVRSQLRIPLVAGEQSAGLILFKSRLAGFFTAGSERRFESLARTLAIAIVFQRAQLAQRERVKELACLYEIAKIVTMPHDDSTGVIQKIAEYLPSAWLYPEIAEARIMLDGQSYTTRGFGYSRHRQRSDILVMGGNRGFVEVTYREDRPECDEGPFLAEERSLIDTIARELAIFVQRKKAEADKIRLQEQLRHADRLATIGQLAAGVAHELNEPLGGILGFAQLAKRVDALPEQVRRDLDKIEAASLYAREVVRKLMLFARQTPPAKKRINLNQIVVDGLYFLEARCQRAGIELQQALQPDLPEITADPAQIHQVLVNLVVNGIQAIEAGGRIGIATREAPDGVILTVSDSGCGMSEEIQKNLFVPFFTTKDVGEGTGLGLCVVHGIVSAHGGSIEVQSVPGQGSQFEIRLPLESVEQTHGK